MGLIPCPECKQSISETAANCPKCGYALTSEKVAEVKNKQQELQKKFGIGCLSVIGIIALISVASSNKAIIDLLRFLVYLALVCMIIGLIRPSIISRLVKTEISRKKIFYIFGGAMAACILIINMSGSSSEKPSRPKNAKEIREEQLEKIFSPWDGSCKSLTTLVKESMNDPSSYEHVETKYWDMHDHLVVITTFRGKNAYGGVVKNWVKAKVDLNGNVIKVIEQGP